MPFLDRFWWFRLAGAATLSYFAGLTLLSWAPESYQFNEEFHRTQDSYLLFGLGVLFLLIAIGLGISAYYAQRRKWMRRCALKGDPSVMPLAKAEPDASKAPVHSAEPLEVVWRVAPKARRNARWGVAFVGVWMLIAVGLSVFVALIPPEPTSYESYFITWPIAITNHQFMWYVLPFMQLLYPLLLLALVLPQALAFPTGISVSDDGMLWRTEWGRRRFLRWEDARVFEAGMRRLSDRRYILYGKRGYVRLEDYTTIVEVSMPGAKSQPTYEPDSVSQDEMTRRISATLNIIAARTGLPLRTPYISLRRKAQSGAPLVQPAAHAPSSTERRWPALLAFAITSILVGAGFIALGAVIILWPLSSAPILNMVGGVAYGVLGLLTILYGTVALPVIAARERNVRSMPDYQERPLPAHLFTTSGEFYVYTLPRLRILTFYLVSMFALIVIGSVAGVPAILETAGAFGQALGNLGSTTSAPFDPFTNGLRFAGGVLAIVALLAGVSGIRLLRGSHGWRRQTHVDATGLRVEWGNVKLSMPWDVVETLTLTTRDGEPQFYRVTGAAGKFVFQWSARLQPTPSQDTTTEAYFISAAQLAALIERQTNVRRSIEETKGRRNVR